MLIILSSLWAYVTSLDAIEYGSASKSKHKQPICVSCSYQVPQASTTWGKNIPNSAAGWVRALIRPRGMAEGSAAREGHVDQLTEQKVSTAARACLQVFKPAVRLLTDSRCKAIT